LLYYTAVADSHTFETGF